MGGGDLNMKKHFHPLTRENLERVWKAEQKRADEQKKIEERRKEIEDERCRDDLRNHAEQNGVVQKKDSRLEWMYSGNQVNHEEYLLGRPVDSHCEILKDKDEEKIKTVPGASFLNNSVAATTDLIVKIKEDPLFLIKKKELIAKSELVQNPLKLRHLREKLMEMASSKRKHRHHRYHRESPKKAVKSSDSEDDSSSRRHHRHKAKRHDSKYRSRSPSNDHGAALPLNGKKAARSGSTSGHGSSSKGIPNRRQLGAPPITGNGVSRKLDEAELERRRQAMLQNAKWMAEQKEKRIKTFEESEAKAKQLQEKEMQAYSKGYKAKFLREMESSSVDSPAMSSVEDRIKRTIFSKQRTAAALSGHFTKQ